MICEDGIGSQRLRIVNSFCLVLHAVQLLIAIGLRWIDGRVIGRDAKYVLLLRFQLIHGLERPRRLLL